jgi:hypothetical protein
MFLLGHASASLSPGASVHTWSYIIRRELNLTETTDRRPARSYPDSPDRSVVSRRRGEPVLGACGRADDTTVTRARGWAVLRALNLISIGRNGRLGLPGGKPTWEPAGYATLDRVLAAG